MRSNKSKIVSSENWSFRFDRFSRHVVNDIIVSQSFYIQYMFDGTLRVSLGFLPRKGKEKSLNTTSKRFEFSRRCLIKFEKRHVCFFAV